MAASEAELLLAGTRPRPGQRLPEAEDAAPGLLTPALFVLGGRGLARPGGGLLVGCGPVEDGVEGDRVLLDSVPVTVSLLSPGAGGRLHRLHLQSVTRQLQWADR